MKKGMFLLGFATALSAMAAFGQQTDTNGLQWYSNMVEAQQVSAATKKPIFAFFTGSDWCGWCHKLQRDVFAKQDFIDWARKNVILVELDFPRHKQLPQEIVQQNFQLQKVFGVQGYPTIWMFFLTRGEENQYNIDALGSLGYPAGAEKGKEEVKFLKNANDLLARAAN